MHEVSFGFLRHLAELGPQDIPAARLAAARHELVDHRPSWHPLLQPSRIKVAHELLEPALKACQGGQLISVDLIDGLAHQLRRLGGDGLRRRFQQELV